MEVAVGFKILIFFLNFFAEWSLSKGEDCVWDKDLDYPQNPPLILDSSSKQLVLPVLEGDTRLVRISSGSALTLACSKTFISVLGLEVSQAVCLGGKLVEIEGKEWNIVELGCEKEISEVIHKDLGSCGDQDKGTYESIGFEIVTTGDFYELIRVCFDTGSETTIFSEHVIHGANIAAKDVDPGRPSFKTSGFFSVSMDTVYATKNQLELMKQLLQDDELASQIIDTSKQFYFAKGHMSPDADFVTTAESDSTYYYINAVPQWQAFNNGNWKYLEYDTRDLAELHSSDLTVYSGGWGTLELDDINGNPVEIHLGLFQGKKVVPAPALTWKVVYEEKTNRAAAVVGINNPHLTEPPEHLCNNICPELTWLSFEFEELIRGYTYCCTVADLRAAIPNIPDLGDVDLLRD